MMQSAHIEAHLAKLLPACQRCRRRKIKCDRQPPKCSHCAACKATCIIVDPVTSDKYSRDYIDRLEKQEKELRAKVEATSSPNQTTIETRSSPASTPRSNAFVGDVSGLSFLHSIFSDPRWRSSEPQLLEQLAERPRPPEHAVAANSQPSMHEATCLLDNYFGRFHINRTFLLRQEVIDTFERIYHPDLNQQASAQDYFRLFMVFSISAVTRYRSGASNEHPYGYYLAAQSYINEIPLVGSMDAVQNLLLIARLGMYHLIGISIWDISRFCMRQCIELGLHKPPRKPLAALSEQHQRRVFWECYILDRYSSSVLGRPFAISDFDITVDLPLAASDDIIRQASKLDQLEAQLAHDNAQPSELSVFVFIIKLRRITSRIYCDFYSGRNLVGSDRTITTHSAGDVYVRLYQFLHELEDWRRNAPTFSDPSTLYKKPEWYDFLLSKEKLLVVRAALCIVPRPKGQPPLDLLRLSLSFATDTIHLYDDLVSQNCITWSRSYFQVIFAAGLSIFYCVTSGVDSRGTNPNTKSQSSQRHSVWSTLTLCSRILQGFKKEMPDAGRFAIVFEMLRSNVSRNNSRPQTPPRPLAVPGEPIETSLENSLEVLQNTAFSGHGTSGIDLLADVAAWPRNVDSYQPVRLEGVSSQQHVPTSPAQLDPLTMDADASQEEMFSWPMLTDEFITQLETDLGEFAWDVTLPWGDTSGYGQDGMMRSV